MEFTTANASIQLGSHFAFSAAVATRRETPVSMQASISLHVLDPASGNEIYLLFQHDTVKTTHCLEYIHFKLEKVIRKIRFD